MFFIALSLFFAIFVAVKTDGTTIAKGHWGEDLACAMLLDEGATIRERNWRSGHLEIDIIAAKDDILIFAEVKTRADLNIDPLEAIDKRKQQNMVRAAVHYMGAFGREFGCRFDYFAINGTPDSYRIEHLPDAFSPTMLEFS